MRKGTNPPKAWQEEHPQWLICSQCLNSFEDRTELIKHLKKAGATCKWERDVEKEKT